MKKFLCILLAVLLTFAACSEGEDVSALREQIRSLQDEITCLQEENAYLKDLNRAHDDYSVIAVFRGGTLTFSEVYPVYAEALNNYRTICEAADLPFDESAASELIGTVTEGLITEKLVASYVEKQGISLLDEEEIAALTAQAEAEYESLVAEYVAYFVSDGLDGQAARAEAEMLLAGEGSDRQTLIGDSVEAERIRREMTVLAGEVIVTEEDLRACYEQMVEDYRTYYADEPEQYAVDLIYGDHPLFVPEGYRRVKRYSLDTGIAEAGEYLVCEGSYLLPEDVTAAVMALTAPGETTQAFTDPDNGLSYSYEYVSSMESGPVPFEEAQASLSTVLYEDRLFEQYNAKINELIADAEIVYFLERMN